MKTKLFAILFAFATIVSFSQDFSGKAIYKTSRKSNFKIGGDSKLTDQQKEQLQARFQKMNQKTFILNFDKYTSTYKQDVKLKAPKPNVGGANVMMMSFGGSGEGSIYYKNIKEDSKGLVTFLVPGVDTCGEHLSNPSCSKSEKNQKSPR